MIQFLQLFFVFSAIFGFITLQFSVFYLHLNFAKLLLNDLSNQGFLDLAKLTVQNHPKAWQLLKDSFKLILIGILGLKLLALFA